MLNGAINEEEDEVSGDDHTEGGHEHNETNAGSGEGNAQKDMVLFTAPSDSGIGTEVPSTALEHSEADYFRRAAEEGSLVE